MPATCWCGHERHRSANGETMNLGLSGRLTQATIHSKLTPLFLLAALTAGLVALFAIPRALAAPSAA